MITAKVHIVDYRKIATMRKELQLAILSMELNNQGYRYYNIWFLHLN